MARWPAPGRCKRRLAADLHAELGLNHGDERSARLQARLMNHTFAVARGLHRQAEVTPVLAVSGLGPGHARRWGRQHGIDTVRLQGEGNLGTRIKRQLLPLRRHRVHALVVGSDLPDVHQRDLLMALENLQSHDLVLGPAADGGYWLIALSAELMQTPARWPLAGIPWGSDDVCRCTLEYAHCFKLSVALLRHQQDLDHLRDLNRWQGCRS